MSVTDDIWELERRCWVEGKSYYQQIITEHSVYAFPPPMGIFKGVAFVDQMGEAGPCTSVEFKNQHLRIMGDAVVLVYQGIGTSADGSLRESNCSSLWEKSASGWVLAVHHQTPIVK